MAPGNRLRTTATPISLDVMMQRDVSASVVQRINRIGCRRIIDTQGVREI